MKQLGEAAKAARAALQSQEIAAGEARLRREYEALGIEPVTAGGVLISPTLARKLGVLPDNKIQQSTATT